jgi:hypothetical protein
MIRKLRAENTASRGTLRVLTTSPTRRDAMVHVGTATA